jgi:ankyrin repeat protein
MNKVRQNFLATFILSCILCLMGCVRPQTDELCAAAASGNTQKLESLLSSGSSPNVRDFEGQTPLTYAASRGHQDTVIALIKAGADTNLLDSAGNSPLYWTSISGCYDCAVALAEHGGRVTSKATIEYIKRNFSRFPKLDQLLRSRHLLPTQR